VRVIVDTNIVFSAMLNTHSNIAEILIKSSPFEFYAPSYILQELNKHNSKLHSLLGIPSEEITVLKKLIFERIEIIQERKIQETFWIEAERLTKDVDHDDIAFVALALHLDALLWTGDKKLSKGLMAGGFKNVIDAQYLKAQL